MRIGSIDINHLITFCKIFNDFDSMCKDLVQLFDYYDEDTFFIIDSVVSGTSNEFHAKLFYNKYKNTLDIISKNSGIFNFFYCIYAEDYYFDENFRLFYRYIRENKIRLNDILELLLSIRELGVSKITLDLVNNLKSLRHGMYKEFDDNACINYVTDVKFIPEYGDRIIYKSNSGNYILKLKVFNDGFYSNGREIIVSNLMFDKDSLPQEISKESTYDKIILEKTEFDNIYNAIDNVVELNKIIMVLNEMISKLSRILDSIDKDGEKCGSLYEEFINKIIELENIRDEYEDKIMSEYNIDRSEIEYQKKLGLK